MRRTALLLCLLAPLGAAAQAPSDTERCADQMEAPDLRIGACTRLIESGTLSGKDLAVPLFYRAVAHATNRDNNLAIADYTRTLEAFPEAPTAANARGDLHFRAGRYQQAAEDFALSARLDPEWAVPLDNLGLAQMQLGQLDQAIDSYTRALKISPTWPNPMMHRGEAQLRRKAYGEAIQDLSQAIERDPSSAFARRGRGDAYVATGKYAEAVKDFDRAVQVEPQDAYGLVGRAVALYLDGSARKARQDVEAAVKLAPDDPWLVNRLCYQLATHDQAKEALPYCERAVKLKPDSADSRDSRGFAYLKLNRFKQAADDYTEALARNARHAYALYGRCLALKGLRRSEADADCEDARAMDPGVDAFFAAQGLRK